jgi:hypothetical protein
MASLYVLSNKLIPEAAYKESLMLGQLEDLVRSRKTAETHATIAGIEFSSKSFDLNTDPTVPFKEIGIGKPLSAEIMCIYSGDFIHGFLAGRKRDLLCVSGVRSTATFDASSRAMNLLRPKVAERDYLNFTATEPGTPYIYYTKAVDSSSLLLSLELDGDSFNDSLFATISDLLSKAAGLPLFMPASGYLLAGSQLSRIVAEGGNALFESAPFMSASTTINFATAGLPTNIARSMVICRDEHIAEFDSYTTQVLDFNGTKRMRLVKDGKEYRGKAPYIIINIDGGEKPDLENFTPTLATNAILKRFYGADNKIAEASKILVDALGLYNDFNYRTKADRIKRKLAELDSSGKKQSDEYKNAESLYNAYKANIQNELLQLS